MRIKALKGSNFYLFDGYFERTQVWSGIRSPTFFRDRNISYLNVLQKANANEQIASPQFRILLSTLDREIPI